MSSNVPGRFRQVALVLAVSLMALACNFLAVTTPSPSGSASPSASPTPTATPAPTASPSPPPTASPSPVPSPTMAPPPRPPTPSPTAPPPAGSVIVTFQVEAEEYRILLTDADDIEIAQRLLAGEEAPGIPNGEIVRGETGVNTGWSWHIDPATLEFADITVEVCDGLPSHVEDGTLAGDRYCPWGAQVIDIESAA